MLDRVTDTENHKVPDPTREAEEKLGAAQDAFQKAFMIFVEAAMDYGWEMGWSAGHDSGWDAAFEHLKSQEAAMRAAAKGDRPRAPSIPQATLPFLHVGSQMQRRTASDSVLDYIQKNPGLRGVDIAEHFAAASPPIPERTVRTALHRLRHFAFKIKVVDGKWYAADIDEQPAEQAVSQPTIRRR